MDGEPAAEGADVGGASGDVEMASPAVDDVEIIDLTHHGDGEADDALPVYFSDVSSDQGPIIVPPVDRSAQVITAAGLSVELPAEGLSDGRLMWFITEGELHERIDANDPDWVGNVNDFLGRCCATFFYQIFFQVLKKKLIG